ncbi:MAG: hypothetical protein WBC22_13295, partial [Sedimentisphaerales bacterium]
PYVLAALQLTTCGSPLYPLPTGGLRLPTGKHTGILTDFQTEYKKKMKKSAFFAITAEARTNAKFYRAFRGKGQSASARVVLNGLEFVSPSTKKLRI